MRWAAVQDCIEGIKTQCSLQEDVSWWSNSFLAASRALLQKATRTVFEVTGMIGGGAVRRKRVMKSRGGTYSDHMCTPQRQSLTWSLVQWESRCLWSHIKVARSKKNVPNSLLPEVRPYSSGTSLGWCAWWPPSPSVVYSRLPEPPLWRHSLKQNGKQHLI